MGNVNVNALIGQKMKILFLTDKYWPKPLANAICAQNIADSFIESGHSVDILAYSEEGIQTPKEHNGVRVFTVKPSRQLRLINYARNFPDSPDANHCMKKGLRLSRIKHAALLPWFPLSSISAPKRMEEKVEELYGKYQYDIVVSVFSPFEAAVSGLRFKRKHPECFWALYTLDTFVNLRQSHIPERLRDAHYWIPKFLTTADIFICMKSRIGWYEEHGYCSVGKGVVVSDIPMLTKSPNFMNSDSQNKSGNWVYAGSLYKTHYDVTDLLVILEYLCKDDGPTVHFYSSGAEAESLKVHPLCKAGKIAVHGYVDHDELMRIYDRADVLLSIKTSDQISAKIFEYMTYGKPVLHISSCKKDPDIHYVEQYAKGFALKAYEVGPDEGARLIEKWMSEEAGYSQKNIDLSDFEMNTPAYTRNLLIDAYNARTI